MSSSFVLSDGVQQKLAGIIENIIQVDMNFSSDDLSIRLKDIIKKRTKDEPSRIDTFATILRHTSDYLASRMDGHFSSSKSKSSSSKSTAPRIQQKLAGIIKKILQVKIGIWSNRLSSRLQDIIQRRTKDEQFRINIFAKILDCTFDAEPESTAKGATTEYDGPRNILVEIDSENNTGDAYTDVLEYSRGETGKADDDITTDSQIDDPSSPACGIIFISAALIKERSLLTRAWQECKSSLTLLAWLSILMIFFCRSFSTGRGRRLFDW
jgi:hypothetical protein